MNSLLPADWAHDVRKRIAWAFTRIGRGGPVLGKPTVDGDRVPDPQGLLLPIGNLGGFVGPSLIGFARETTNSFFGGLMVIAASLLGAAIVAIAVPHSQQLEAEPRASAA